MDYERDAASVDDIELLHALTGFPGAVLVNPWGLIPVLLGDEAEFNLGVRHLGYLSK